MKYSSEEKLEAIALAKKTFRTTTFELNVLEYIMWSDGRPDNILADVDAFIDMDGEHLIDTMVEDVNDPYFRDGYDALWSTVPDINTKIEKAAFIIVRAATERILWDKGAVVTEPQTYDEYEDPIYLSDRVSNWMVDHLYDDFVDAIKNAPDIELEPEPEPSVLDDVPYDPSIEIDGMLN